MKTLLAALAAGLLTMTGQGDGTKTTETNPDAPATKQDLEDLKKAFTEKFEGVDEEAYNEFFYLQGGLTLLESYALTPNPGTPLTYKVATDSTEARGFIEFNARSRYAWHTRLNAQALSGGEFAGNTALCATPSEIKNKTKGSGGLGGIPLDFELRGGLVFAGSDNEGTAVVGSGDAYAEFKLGLPVFIEWKDAEAGRQPTVITANIEANTSFVSSRTYSDTHTQLGIGAALVMGIPVTKSQRKAEVYGWIGYAWLDVPAVDATGNVPADAIGSPVFDMEPALGFIAEVRYPVGKGGFISFGGRLYNSEADPDPWTMHVGYSMPLSALGKIFGQ